MYRYREVALIAVVCGAVVSASPAQAQWALLAKRAIGRVQQMQEQAAPGQASQGTYDVATVVLAAPAERVYATALEHIRHNAELRIVAQDPKARQLQITNGVRSAGLTVTPLGPKLSQLVVASVRPPGDSSATSIVVDGVMRVCAQLKVKCTLE